MIFPAIRRTGKIPPVFVRSWGFDLEHASYSNSMKLNIDEVAEGIYVVEWKGSGKQVYGRLLVIKD